MESDLQQTSLLNNTSSFAEIYRYSTDFNPSSDCIACDDNCGYLKINNETRELYSGHYIYCVIAIDSKLWLIEKDSK